MGQNLDLDPHKKRIQEGIIKDMRREVKSLRKQAKRVRTDADGSDDDENENDYAVAHGRSDGEVQETENV